MKKRITLIFALWVTGHGFSQMDPNLYMFTWYLHSIEIDGVSYNAPLNDEVPSVTLDFSETTPNFITTVCNDIFGDIEAVDPFESFRFPNGIDQTLIKCVDSDNAIFESRYFNDFIIDHIGQPFEYGIYIIDSQGPTYGLDIWWPGENYRAHYYDELVLDIPTNDLPRVAIFPNPMSDTFQVKFINEIAFPVQVSLIDASGRRVVSENLVEIVDHHQLDVQEVPNGFYFVTIEDNNGYKLTKKMVK